MLLRKKILKFGLILIFVFTSSSAFSLTCNNTSTGSKVSKTIQVKLDSILKSVNQKAVDISWVQKSEPLKSCFFNGSSRVGLTFSNGDSVTYEIRNETLVLIKKAAWSNQPVSGTCYSVKSGKKFPSNGVFCN